MRGEVTKLPKIKILCRGTKNRLLKCNISQTESGVVGTLYIDRVGQIAKVYEYLYGGDVKLVTNKNINPRISFGSLLDDVILKVDFEIISAIVGANVNVQLESILHSTNLQDLYAETLPTSFFFKDLDVLKENIRSQLLSIFSVSVNDFDLIYAKVNEWRKNK